MIKLINYIIDTYIERRILKHPSVQTVFAEEELRHKIDLFERNLNKP